MPRASASERAPTVLVGLVGRGIQLSRTPFMHEAEGHAQGLAYVYRLIDTDRMGTPPPALADIVRQAEFFGFSGLNVTFPYKQEILPLLDELSPAARDLGSVNTVVLRDGRRIGHNTDMWGFRESFRQAMDGVPRDIVLLLGAGGAGAAVGFALLELGVGRLLVHDVEPSRAEALSARLETRFGAGRARPTAGLADAAAEADGVVNATPVGMAKMEGTPLPPELVRADHWVGDVIYFPIETPLLRHARRLGCRTLSGEGMAIGQAARAFELFTGLPADTERMRAAFAAFEANATSPQAAEKRGLR
ncbi:MAG TPA: shikimate dehydrogenase [Rhizobiales bacterium]|nr:shikimate dehydrogenase [Hyphomicrobiales bacterium]